MIKLLNEKGEIKNYSNRQGIKILREKNPKDKFKIAKCKGTGKEVIMVKDFSETGEFNGHKNWLCLHD